MVFEIIVPEITSKPRTGKDAALSILTIEWPLSLKRIHNRIKKIYGYKGSYQSVYKAVKELVKLEVLQEKNKEYCINVDWIKRLQSFTDIIETNYYAKHRINSVSGVTESKKNEDILILNFDSLFDAEKYLYYFIKQELSKLQKSKVVFMLANDWRSAYYLRAEYNFYRRLQKKGHKFFVVCSGKSEIESEAKRFYKSIDVRYRTSDKQFAHDTLAFGEYFIQIYVPEELRKEIKELLEKEDLLNLLKKLEHTGGIRVIITKDKQLSKQIQEEFGDRKV